MRFVFTPPAGEAAGLLSLPWDEPLEPMDQTAHGPAHGASCGTGDRQPLEADASSE